MVRALPKKKHGELWAFKKETFVVIGEWVSGLVVFYVSLQISNNEDKNVIDLWWNVQAIHYSTFIYK